MFWAFVGIVIGVLIGIFSKFSIPPEYARYTAVAILAMVDSIFGAWRADLVSMRKYKTDYTHRGPEKKDEKRDKYDPVIFITGLIFNTALASAFTYLGDRLGLDIYIAVIVVFTWRIFMNLGVVRRILFHRGKWGKEK
ncbi:MAG: small basic protein [uncultured bacterium]|nr:MAG: small basic protein [uncultured bacterium]